MINPPPPFASGLIDRDADTRMSEDALRAAWSEPQARLLQLRGAEIPGTSRGSDGHGLALLPTTGTFEATRENCSVGHVYLGRMNGAPVFAESVDSDAQVPAGGEWSHIFVTAEKLPDAERELVAIASGLLRWHEAARFSPRDGSETTAAQGGWARTDAHGSEFFPRTDPAVIVLIEHDGRVLLGSNALWETGRFSLLAGFVETGEPLEQAVIREVFEESGVRVGEVTYVGSQPWPFPRSLMLGFRATLADGADPEHLVPAPDEISELRWFSRDQLRNPEPGITLPGGASIARWLLDLWVAEGDPGDR